MVSLCQQAPRSPKQATRRKAAVDRLLDVSLFKALGDPTRTRLLACLIKCGRPCSVTEVAECCDVDFSVVARHLAVLARAGAVEAHKQGRVVWYRARCGELSDRFRSLADAIDIWCPPTKCSGPIRVDGDSPTGCCP